jgi:hypothetical protein
MTTFATDLDALIRRHLGKPKWGDDFADTIGQLYAAANRLAEEADAYRFTDESEFEFRERRKIGRVHL